MIRNRISVFFMLGCLIPLLFSCSQSDSKASKEDLHYFAMLDSVLNNAKTYESNMNSKVADLRQKTSSAQSTDALYFYQKLIAESYYYFEPDTAIQYLQKNIQLAQQENKQEWMTETLISLATVKNAEGNFEEARDNLNQAQKHALSKENKLNYYVEKINYWSNRNLFMGKSALCPETKAYGDSILMVEPDEHSPYHMFARIWTETEDKEKTAFAQKLRDFTDQMDKDDRWYGIIAMWAGYFSENFTNPSLGLKYYVLGLCSDIEHVSRHLLMLPSVARLAVDMGEMHYATRFYNAVMAVQADYPERIHNSIGRLNTSLTNFHSAVEKQLEDKNNAIQYLLYGMILLAILAIGLLIFVVIQLRKRIALHKELEDSMQQLTAKQTELKQVLDELQGKESELKNSNSLLTEANYLKEEYIGQLFATCSEYLDKMEKFKLTIHRKLKASQYEDALRQTDTKEVRDNEELHELWNRFDDVFLKLFPDFLEQFNQLLRPEERITLKKEEKLNTDLRIYALVRLGINSSVKIGKILGVSTQTVYNARMKMRARATESELEFPVRVRQLKGINPPEESYEKDDLES